jgi:hypothetical protein
MPLVGASIGRSRPAVNFISRILGAMARAAKGRPHGQCCEPCFHAAAANHNIFMAITGAAASAVYSRLRPIRAAVAFARGGVAASCRSIGWCAGFAAAGDDCRAAVKAVPACCARGSRRRHSPAPIPTRYSRDAGASARQRAFSTSGAAAVLQINVTDW